MYALPISDTEAVAIDDADADRWEVHFLDYTAQRLESFEVEGLGAVQSMHYDPGRGLLWVIVDGTVFAIHRSDREIFEVDGPDENFFVYAAVGQGSHVYVAGEYSNLWRIEMSTLTWEPLSTPEPKPPRAADPKEQTRRVRDYAERYPPFYAGFAFNDGLVFCGALGALAEVRGAIVERHDLDTRARLVTGRPEGALLSLSADSPAGEIYLGSFTDGFEQIFLDNLRALNLTAVHDGKRYVGVAHYPPSDVHNLYLREPDELVPVETGCAREPVALTALSVMGQSLWATDVEGIFRMSDGVWTLVTLDDLRRRVWPTGG